MSKVSPTVRQLLAGALCAALAPLSSCGQKATVAAAPDPTSKTSGNGTKEQASATKPDDEYPTTTEAPASDDSGGGDDSGATADAGGGVGDILKDCGVTEKELSDPTSIIFEKDFTSWPKVFHGNFNAVVIAGTYVVSVKTKVHVKATLGQTKQTTDIDVTGNPDKAVAQAKETAAPNKGSVITTAITTEERTKLGSTNKDWTGILCTISAAKSAIVDKGGTNRVYSFNPPMPNAVSPRANKDRYAAEIGKGRTFSNIELTVDSSTDPKYPKGTKVTGSVKITPKTPKLTLQVGDEGKETVVTTDVAYQIETDFGGPKATAALGFLPTTTMFINAKTKELKIIVGDTGDPDLGMVVLSDELK